jgi:uncharacterized protein YecT (DUF1311 family)
MLSAIVVASLLAAEPDVHPTCAQDEVPWKGRCFGRYEWEPDDPTCPYGVIVIPEGKKAPSCIRCDDYLDGMQQPMNYCSGMRAAHADANMKATFDDLLKRLPTRARELQKAQRDWLRRRNAACAREGEQYEGGSMQPQVESECRLDRTRKRIDELARMAGATAGLAAPPTPGAAVPAAASCGALSGQARVDRRALVVAEKSHFHDQPKSCPAEGHCPWRRQSYVVRGDAVAETSLSQDFACVTYKATTGWLPRNELCEAGEACASKSTRP